MILLETAKSVTGLLKWTVDLMIYVMNDLIELANECKKHEADRGFVQKKGGCGAAMWMGGLLTDSCALQFKRGARLGCSFCYAVSREQYSVLPDNRCSSC